MAALTALQVEQAKAKLDFNNSLKSLKSVQQVAQEQAKTMLELTTSLQKVEHGVDAARNGVLRLQLDAL